MVEINKQEPNEFEKRGVNPFNNPTPGEGLTRSPDEKFPWEQAPRFTEMKPAIEEIFLTISEREPLIELIGLLQNGMPVDEIAQVILYKGYRSGKFNPDMVLLLAEPTIYLLIAIADYADIKDYVLYEGEEEDDPDTEIPGDDITPINMDDDEPTEEVAKPTEEVLSESLLSKVKKELPAKVEAVVETKKEVKE